MNKRSLLRCRGNGIMKQAVLLCCLMTAMAISGCSAGPSDRQARSDLQEWFDVRWPGAVTVEKYETVGRQGDKTTCIITYKARARFLRDMPGCVTTCCGDVCIDRLVDGFAWKTKASGDTRVIVKGDVFETAGRKTCVKSGGKWKCGE